MKFYTKNHQHYYGIDLHTKNQYLCVLDQQDEILFHKNLPTTPKAFLGAIKPFREDLIVGAECMLASFFSLADISIILRLIGFLDFIRK